LSIVLDEEKKVTFGKQAALAGGRGGGGEAYGPGEEEA